jgi:hypothetical protein
MLAVMACGAEAPPASGPVHSSPPAAPTNDRLYLGDGSALTVVDAATGEVRRTMPAGAPSPDWSRLYSVAGSYANVQLRLVDAATGEINRVLPVPNWVSEARLSANGLWLALVPKPDPRAPITRFQVRPADLTQQPIDVELAGAFAFDGLSGDRKREVRGRSQASGVHHQRWPAHTPEPLSRGTMGDRQEGGRGPARQARWRRSCPVRVTSRASSPPLTPFRIRKEVGWVESGL